MQEMKANRVGVVVLAALLTLAGCAEGDYGRAEPEDLGTPADASAEPLAVATIEVGPEGSAMLARADAVDGSRDNVVALCSGCSLAMPGHADHAIQAGEYEMHFCSDSCQGRFMEEGEAAIVALDLPAGDETTATD